MEKTIIVKMHMQDNKKKKQPNLRAVFLNQNNKSTYFLN